MDWGLFAHVMHVGPSCSGKHAAGSELACRAKGVGRVERRGILEFGSFGVA